MALTFKQITVARGEHTNAHQTYLFGLTEEGVVYQYIDREVQYIGDRARLVEGWQKLTMDEIK